MARLEYERYCDAIVDGADRFADAIRETDAEHPVPTCPEWTLAQLVTHVGQAHRWVTMLVERRAAEPGESPDVIAPGSAAERAGWLSDGARGLAAALREAGPDAAVWTWSTEQRAGFWARRMTHETAVHRADAELAVGRGGDIAPELAADGLSEWLDILSLPTAGSYLPDLMELLREEPTLHFHATDEGLGERGEWLLHGGPSGMAWEYGHSKGDVAVRGPAAALLLVLLRRIPASDPRLQVLGDAALLDRWLERTRF